ncbi:unnamed protein product [Mytilus coruscus]|uniref:G-protein coupled receptors family 1 profile domain-containing protein n=1 Tax=Mytilus coruscus TaxID=42192 RepID=A0A6J8CZE9_MYTCO|nr:unnamed protein product [Mytilus coruscus]
MTLKTLNVDEVFVVKIQSAPAERCLWLQISVKDRAHTMLCSDVSIPGLAQVIRYIMFSIVVLLFDTVVLFIWIKPSNRSAVTMCLSLLAICDVLSIVCATTNALTGFTSDEWNDIWFCPVYQLSHVLSVLFHSISVLVTMCLALQRFVVCAFPFKGRQICNKKLQIGLVTISFLLPIGFISPNLYGLHTLRKVTFQNMDSLGNDTKWYNRNFTDFNIEEGSCLALNNKTLSEKTFTAVRDYTAKCISSIMLSEEILRGFLLWRIVFLHVLPSITITFCMGFCLLTVRKTNIRKLQTRRVETVLASHRKKTLLLALVMFSILTGEIPNCIYLILEMVYGKPREDIWLLSRTGQTFCELFTASSYLHNVVIYIAMSRQFRRAICEQFPCKRK